jgi:hypothetical protein
MAATITGNSTSATVASVKLRASVSTVIPIVGLTRIYPVSEVAYILLAVSAYLDTTGQFKYTTDLFSVTDTTSFSTSKIADVDTFTTVDDTTRSTGKGLSDSATMGDSVLTVLVFIRDFTDTASLADVSTLLVSPAYSDAITPSDTIAQSFSKALTDSFALNDLSDAAGPTFSFADFTNNVVSATDNSIFSNSKILSDSFSLSDSGVGTVQDYCDITYFLTDYVGQSVTF